MQKLFKRQVVLGLLATTAIVVGSFLNDTSKLQAQNTILADCCQEPDDSCRDRFGWNHADSRVGPICGPVDV